MEKKFQDMLDKAVIGLFRGKCSSFLSTIYCSLKIYWTEEFETACTNGLELRINPHWFESLSGPMRTTLLAHELWHIAYMHMERVGNRNFVIWNMAADHAINLMLIDHGYVFDRKPNGQMLGLADPRFKDMTSEQIYDILIQENPPEDLPFGSDISLGSGNQELSPGQKQEVIANIIRANTMAQLGNEAGHLPGEFSSMMAELLRPKINWANRLDRWLTERNDEGYTWARPHRRFQDVYLPSKAGKEGLTRLIYAIDVSGSMTDEQVLVINSELKGIKEKFLPESMLIVSFDTKIHDTWEFSTEHDISSLEIHGRGGTNMIPVFNLLETLKPDGLIMFSDMYCHIPGKPKGLEVLWICLDNPDWKAPYGQVIHIDTTRDI